MVKTILSDFSRIILFPKDKTYPGGLNAFHGKLQQEKADYIFFNYFYFNEELLKFYESIRDRYELCVLTESVAILEVLEVRTRLEKIFSHIFTTHDIGFSKADFHAYLDVAKKLSREPLEILFIDDRTANLDAAKGAGLQTIQYFSNDKLFDELKTRFHIGKS